jgi:Protein of unknown function (DUF664)
MIAPHLAQAYLDRAFDQMVAVLDRVTDDEIPVRPFGPSTSSVSGLVMHCAGVCEWWLGHVGLGEPTDRDREAELRSEAGRDELLSRIAVVRASAPGHLARLAAGEGRPHEARASLDGDGSDDSVVLHVLEELYQHLGHLDVSADALVARRG